MMVFAASALTGCTKEESKMVLQVGSVIDCSPNISTQTEQIVKNANKRLDDRLKSMFGETFAVKPNDQGDIDKETQDSFNSQIDNDSEIKNIVNELRQLKDEYDYNAVREVSFVFFSGTARIWTHIY